METIIQYECDNFKQAEFWFQIQMLTGNSGNSISLWKDNLILINNVHFHKKIWPKILFGRSVFLTFFIVQTVVLP